jgi:hypothetical protein
MEQAKFEVVFMSEFEHSVNVDARSPQDAVESASRRCELGEGAPGVFVEHIYINVLERRADGSRGRSWHVDIDGELIEDGQA